MPKPESKRLVKTLQQTLSAQGCDYTRIIHEFGQVQASEDRSAGRPFTLRDHIRGLVLSLLSNQRQWGPIAQNLSRIDTIFFSYDPEKLRLTDPDYFVQAIRIIRCGNRQIKAQMESLAENIKTLIRIEIDYGSVDSFITSDKPDVIAGKLSEVGRYKLKQVGYTLALEYLRNVGIRAGKPDVHVRRVLSGERLGYFNNVPSEMQAYQFLDSLAHEAGCNPTYLDNLLWIFCAKNFGNICGAKPRCSVCGFIASCNYPSTDISDSG